MADHILLQKESTDSSHPEAAAEEEERLLQPQSGTNDNHDHHDGEEEKKEEDEELLMTTRRSPTTTTTTRSYAASSAVHRNHLPKHESVTDVSVTSVYNGSTDSDNGSGQRTLTLRSTPDKTTPIGDVGGGAVASSPKSSHMVQITNKALLEDKDEDDGNDDDDDDDSICTVDINKRRARERRAGCFMFQCGVVGVVVSIILLSMQIVKDNSSTTSTIVTVVGTMAPTTAAPQQQHHHHQDRTSLILQTLDLPEETIAAIEYDPESPQSWAMDWMLQDSSWDNHTYSQDRARQRFGLATLYYATMQDDTTSSFADFLSHDIPECKWLASERLRCNEQSLLYFLDLDGLGLRGTVPNEVLQLMAPNTLEHLALGHNDITGTLATQLGLLHRLTHLDITQTHVTGAVPSEIGNCQSLQSLAIQLNPLLRGTIPTQVGLLSSLKGLWWRNTGAAGMIPSELGRLLQLQMLDLSENVLTGTIPIELVSDPEEQTNSTRRSGTLSSQVLNHTFDATFVGLRELRLERNRLTGRIPVFQGRSQTSLRALLLAENRFEATALPTHLASLVKLTNLQVGSNKWNGLIPSELGLLSAHLDSLGLDKNSFSGTIPSELLALTHLQHLKLNDNHGLKGKIVDSVDDFATGGLALGRLSNLKELTIGNTQLSGTLSESLCVISILSFTCNHERLCGCDCQCFTPPPSPSPTAVQTTRPPTVYPSLQQRPSYNGTSVPSLAPTTISSMPIENSRGGFVYRLPKYSRLGLDDSQGPQAKALHWLFDDPKVNDYSEYQQLQRFAMATLYYSLYGAEAATNETVWLSHDLHECLWSGLNKSSVTCKTAFQGQERLVLGLNLSPIGLQGSIPPDIALLSRLRFIQSADSNMNGVLPSELGLLPDLQTLSLPNHKLQGPVPSELGQCSSLLSVDLTSNFLGFQLPSELGLLNNLQSFVAPSNFFVGSLPRTLPGSLTTLNLSHNIFRGTIPVSSWASSSKNSLKSLAVGSNSLTGQLGTNIGQLTQLSLLDVSNTELTGLLPSEVGLLSRLTSLDMSENALSGTIPETVGKLTDLQYLTLSNNQFRGNIPEQVGYLAHLKSFRLDGNSRIDGRIPDSLVNLPLSVLRVNETSVAGRIPPGLCFVDDFSFSCTSWLCGCRNCPCQQQ